MAEAPQNKVGIVLVNYNGLRFMPECLESLRTIDYPNARIVIVDNASSDGSREWLAAEYPDLPVLSLPTNRGVTGGNNEGIRWCLENGCDWVLLLNNDTVVEPTFLTALVHHAGPNTLAVPKIYFYDSRTLLNSNVGGFDYWRGLNIQWFYGRPDSPESSQVKDATMASTCAMLIPRRVFTQIGFMDETYFMYYDDADFVTRAVRSGNVVRFVPDSVIYHKESSSSGGRRESPFTVYYLTRNRLYFMVKHQKNPVALLFFFFYFLATRIVLAMRYRRQQERNLPGVLQVAAVDFFTRRFGFTDPKRYNRSE